MECRYEPGDIVKNLDDDENETGEIGRIVNVRPVGDTFNLEIEIIEPEEHAGSGDNWTAHKVIKA